MANLSVYDPFSTRFNRLFNSMLQPVIYEEPRAIELKVDVTEDDKTYVVRADIPGVKKDDIKVEVDGNLVSISAEMKRTKEEKKNGNIVCAERYEGSVYRSFTLGQEVDQATAVAKYTDGVLELTLPKKANGKARQLSIS